MTKAAMLNQLGTMTPEAWWDVVVRHINGPEEPGPRRSEPRYEMRLEPTRLLFHKRGRPCVCSAVVLQGSKHGMMVKTREYVPEGIPVLVEVNDPDAKFVIAAEVRHCTCTVAAYKIGLRLIFPGEANPPADATPEAEATPQAETPTEADDAPDATTA